MCENLNHRYSPKDCVVCGAVFCWECGGPYTTNYSFPYRDLSTDGIQCPVCGEFYYDSGEIIHERRDLC